MDTAVGPKYHRAVFELLGHEPVFSEEATRLIEKAEAECGARLPESVREWYGLRDSVGLLDDQRGVRGPAGRRDPARVALLRHARTVVQFPGEKCVYERALQGLGIR